MPKLRALTEAPPDARGDAENQLAELRDYLLKVVEELEYLLTHLEADNINDTTFERIRSMIPTGYSGLPAMDGTASSGGSGQWARGDHVHPTDTSRAADSALTAHAGDTSNPHGVTAAQAGAVPTDREINGYPLSADVTLDYSDVGAVPATREINGLALTDDITLDADDVGARPDDWTPSAADVGAQAEITASGILKGDGNGGVSAAVAGTDYQTPLTAGTDYATPAMLKPEEITGYTLINATPSIAAIQTAYTTCYRIGKMLFFFLSFQAGANSIAPGTAFADLTVDSNSFALVSGVTGDCAITGTRLGMTRIVLKLIGSSSVAAYDTFGCSMMLLLN